MELTTYPLNNIEYSAEDAELFHVTRTSGVYAKNSFDYSVTGADNKIVIGTGIGWIKNSEFSGKVIALKERISLDMGVADSVYPRIDAVVIQFDANLNETNIIVKNGTASSEPIPPEVSRDEAVYELHLYHVKREAGSLSITPSNITDLRLISSYCGLMADSITSIDTYAIEKQVADLIKSLQNEISNVKDGSAYLLRDGSTGMTGNLQMDGNTITGLGAPVNDNDAVPKNYVMPAIESEAHPGCYYRTVDGVTEWINPPMAAGEEYRTTERYNNLPVYTAIIDGGAIPSTNSQKFVKHNKAVNQIVRYDISTNAYGTAVPGFSFSGSVSQDVSIYGGANQNGVFLAVKNLNWTQFKWWAQIWYTK